MAVMGKVGKKEMKERGRKGGRKEMGVFKIM
jgi:hypothetical protein